MSNHGKDEERGKACLSNYQLDRLRLNELLGEQQNEAATHVQGCDRCRARLQAIEAVVAPVLDMGTAEVPRVPHRRRLWWAFALPTCAAAALVLVVAWPGPSERRKGGGWQLGVIAQDANGHVTSVSAGSALSPGDRLRFEVAAPRDAFVSVISLDAKGAVTPFIPATGEALPVLAGPRRLLDGAVKLDDSLGPERLLLVACPDRKAVASVVEAARTALDRAQGKIDRVDRLDLACTQTSFWIRKETRP